MSRYFLLILTISFFYGCQPEKPKLPNPVMSLHQIGKLATAEHLITKVVKANDDATWYKVGERKMLISCKASIKAGVDLTKLTKKDVTVNDKSISIKLPPAEIIVLNLSPEDIKVEFEEITYFRDKFSAADRDYIMQQAEKQIRRQAQNLNILATACNNASAFITTFFTNAGFEEVIISFQ